MASPEAARMYKIYVNDCLLTLAPESIKLEEVREYDDALLLHYRNSVKLLHNVLDNLEKSKSLRQIVMVSVDIRKLFEDTIGLFRWVEAGGGVVEHPSGEILAIFRKKRWDLPKGKLDPGETFKQAAVREVIEETGLAAVKAHDLITTSMHAFRTGSNARAIKVTKWYAMTTKHREVKWQVEEDIEEARWVLPEQMLNGKFDVYESIRDVVRQYLDMKSV